MMTVREFAEQEGVTPQAVYKLLKTHSKALAGHVQTSKKGRYLDDYAVVFLQERMVGKPAVVYDRKLEQELEQVKRDLKATQDELILKNAMILEAQSKLLQLEDQSGKIQNLEKDLTSFQPLFGRLYIKK